ncbi:MAG: hypothetical protein HY365_00215 [Candidatus Aenigmarchaeota archaeon]|nr:hypothetical protein [Candidatus Aenigmarchaeota archaeon]
MKGYRLTSMKQDREHMLPVPMAGMTLYVSDAGNRRGLAKELKRRQIDIFSSTYGIHRPVYDRSGRLVVTKRVTGGRRNRTSFLENTLSVQDIEDTVDGLLYGAADGGKDDVYAL